MLIILNFENENSQKLFKLLVKKFTLAIYLKIIDG